VRVLAHSLTSKPLGIVQLSRDFDVELGLLNAIKINASGTLTPVADDVRFTGVLIHPQLLGRGPLCLAFLTVTCH